MTHLNTAWFMEGADVETEGFSLTLNMEVFLEDLAYPNNSYLQVTISSFGFSAQVALDYGLLEFSEAVTNLEHLYQQLTAADSVSFKEPYGNQRIVFSHRGSGQIGIEAFLTSQGQGGFVQEMTLENAIDQTDLLTLVKRLREKETIILDLLKEKS